MEYVIDTPEAAGGCGSGSCGCGSAAIDMSVPATVCLDLAKGFEDVAALRRERDIKEGLKAAAEQLCWRRTADRKDAQALSGWSERREFAEGRGEVLHTFEKPVGAGA